LATSSPEARHAFAIDLRVAEATTKQAVSRGRAQSYDAAWIKVWLPFCASLNIQDPMLEQVRDKIPLFQVLATRLRDGRAARGGKPIRGKSVADEILAISKTFTQLGALDPRLNAHGKIDARLSNLWKGMTNQDPPPNRVKPCPIQVLHHAQAIVTAAPTPESEATMDMGWTGYFYLLRTGEHVKTSDNKPLLGEDVALSIGARKLHPFECPLHELDIVTSSAVVFDTQKNRQRGEMIAHSATVGIALLVRPEHWAAASNIFE
jgi:hypothetical protein